MGRARRHTYTLKLLTPPRLFRAAAACAPQPCSSNPGVQEPGPHVLRFCLSSTNHYLAPTTLTPPTTPMPNRGPGRRECEELGYGRDGGQLKACGQVGQGSERVGPDRAAAGDGAGESGEGEGEGEDGRRSRTAAKVLREGRSRAAAAARLGVEEGRCGASMRTR